MAGGVATALAAVATPAWSQDTSGPRLRHRFDLPTALTSAVVQIAGWPLAYRPSPAIQIAQWRQRTDALVTAAARTRRTPTFPAPPVQDTITIPRPSDLAEPTPPLGAELAGLADLGLDATAHLEMRFDQLRNAQCTAIDVVDPGSGCRGGFPTPTFESLFQVRAGGVVSDRLNVNVDFDSEREFNVNNDIRVWYQGLEDEFLQRIEVGNVTFQAPSSQFINAGVPSNSFGLQVEAQVGNLDLRSVFAQQRGSAIRTRSFLVGATATQPVSFESRELDFETGRFFFTVNPALIAGYPDLDILNLDPGALTALERPVDVRVYRLRAQSGFVEENPNLGGIDAVAIRRDSPQRVGPFSWEILVEGRDYYIDPSRFWLALVTRIGREDFLAVSYVTASGDTVGTYPSINGVLDSLELIHEPKRGPEVPTFLHEIRSVYRLGGTEVARNTARLAILLNESERPLSGEGTYLSSLGLARSTDPNSLDEFNRMFPRLRDAAEGAPIRDHFIVFPNLTPFADSTVLVGAEVNDSLYRTPTYLLPTQGPAPRYALRLGFEASGAGDQGTLSLGALQVRAESEKVFIGDRQLVRGVDYEVDYSVGLISFLQPAALFVGPTTVRVQFEENQFFDQARQNVLGFASTYHVSPDVRLHALGMLQNDRTSFTRPVLGIEPQSGFIGALSGDVQLEVPGLTGLIDGLPLVDTDVPSRLDVTAEFAMSQPNPNRLGVAYLDDFEQRASLPISLLERRFQYSSAPASGRGLPLTHLGALDAFESDDAVPLVWQNTIQDINGLPIEFSPRDIDSTIVLTGTGTGAEAVLWLTLKSDTVGGAPDPVTGEPRWLIPHVPGPRWRSIVQPLGGGSGVGVDLSRTEFLEFWVLEDANLEARQLEATLVFDLGRVREDAAASVPTQLQVVGTDTVFAGRAVAGMGRLDTERDTITNVYNAVVDDRGILGDRVDAIQNVTTGETLTDFPLCDLQSLAGLPVFTLGNLRASCTRRNTRLDTEDLNGDNRLDVTVGQTQEDVFRYVFPLGDSRYFVRNGVTVFDDRGRAVTWRLYRVPIREDSLQVGTPNIRQVEALRVTFVVPDQGPPESELSLALARVRLVGAPWLKRADTPIRDLSGKDGELRGEVAVSVVTTEDRELGYESPPGLTDVADRREAAFQIGVTQVNETSLRILANDLRADERAEAFTRFAVDADRNFLQYGALRVWARGRGAGWDEGDLEFFIKVGRDEHNFYLYRTPAQTATWEPEVVIQLSRWLALRAQVESAWLSGQPPSGAAACGGDSTAYVACDGPYLVHVRDPGVSPPNLAAVSEMAVGILRVAEQTVIDPAELWVNDIRLSEVVDNSGFARSINARLSAADFLDLSFVHRNRDENFRQLGEQPPYVTDGSTRIGATMRADKFLPDAWGFIIPVSVQYLRSTNTPFYVERTDLLATELGGLRQPRSSGTVVEASFRRSRRGASTLERVLVDPWTVRARGETTTNVTSYASANLRNRELHVQYDNLPDPRTIQGAPTFLVRLFETLPDWLKNSEFGEAIRSSRFRWNPYQVRFSSSLVDYRTTRSTFRVPVTLGSDSAVRSLRSLRHLWRNEIEVQMRPYNSLGVRLTLASERDLQDYGDSTTTGRLLEQESRALAGLDVGFERSRTLVTELTASPPVANWLRPRVRWTSTHVFLRDPNRSDVLIPTQASVAAFKLPESQSKGRQSEIGATFDAARLVSGIVGDSGLIADLFGVLLPADISFRRRLRSTFDRSPFDPTLGFRLGFGELGSFRAQDGVPATAAGEAATLQASAGARLPASIQVRLSYRDFTEKAWARRDDRQTQVLVKQREWPAMSFSWVWAPRSGLQSLITNISANARYRVVKTATVQTPLGTVAGNGVTTENNSMRFTPSATIVWRIGLTTAFQYTGGSGDGVTSGNITKSTLRDWGASARYAFRLPESFVRMRDRVNSTVSYNTSKVAVCILQVGSEECRTISDSRREQFDIRLDTGVAESVRAGVSFSYVLSDLRHTASRLTQVVFAVFADVTLLAGQIR